MLKALVTPQVPTQAGLLAVLTRLLQPGYLFAPLEGPDAGFRPSTPRRGTRAPQLLRVGEQLARAALEAVVDEEGITVLDIRCVRRARFTGRTAGR